jgi:hypothetical protein
MLSLTNGLERRRVVRRFDRPKIAPIREPSLLYPCASAVAFSLRSFVACPTKPFGLPVLRLRADKVGSIHGQICYLLSVSCYF